MDGSSAERSMPVLPHQASWMGAGMMADPTRGGHSGGAVPPGMQYTPYVLMPASALQYLYPGPAFHGVPGSPPMFPSPGPPIHSNGGNPHHGPNGRPPVPVYNGAQYSKEEDANGHALQGSDDLSKLDDITQSMAEMNVGVGAKPRRQSRSCRKAKRPSPEELETARRRTVFVSELNRDLNETDLVKWFQPAGDVVECRICADMNTSKRFAFVQFPTDEGFEAALKMSGEKLQGTVIKISPSKTPIVPINKSYMPRDEEELERCKRTVYVNQIDHSVASPAIQSMFESICGEIVVMKLKADSRNNQTRIAFIEFKTRQAARQALGMCGAQLGSSQIRVSPSKTPVRLS